MADLDKKREFYLAAWLVKAFDDGMFPGMKDSEFYDKEQVLKLLEIDLSILEARTLAAMFKKICMKINPIIQEIIATKVLAAAEDRVPSGRLSASRLGWPMQWMMLHYFKVLPKPIDEYTLRKFQRGKDVEERIMKWLAPSPKQMQVEVNYRGVAGFADVVLDYPIEVKSTTNMAFKYKQKEGTSRSHRLQGELYALALKYDQFAVAYVASDDYRVLCFEEEVSGEVDKIIDQYEAQKKLGTVPVFVAEEKWQGMAEYNPYPDWQKLTTEEIAEKLSSMGVVVPSGKLKDKK